MRAARQGQFLRLSSIVSESLCEVVATLPWPPLPLEAVSAQRHDVWRAGPRRPPKDQAQIRESLSQPSGSLDGPGVQVPPRTPLNVPVGSGSCLILPLLLSPGATLTAVTRGTGTERRVATWLVVGVGICAAIALVLLGRATAFWGEDVSINGGPLAGTWCGGSAYGVATGGPVYGTSEGGAPSGRDPAYDAACAKAAQPAWEAGKTELRTAIPFIVIAIACALASGILWFRRRRREPALG